jgi:hypothetical protein
MNKERTDRQVEHNSGHLTVKKDTKFIISILYKSTY